LGRTKERIDKGLRVKAYKLFKKRKDGSLGSLYVNARERYPLNTWLNAREDIVPKTLAFRPGWHCLEKPLAPHLKLKKDRVWCEVSINDYTELPRPVCQGGTWFLAKKLKIERILNA
jgi:hypothetical protein